MRAAVLIVPVVAVGALVPPAAAQDGTRFVERTPMPRQPLFHTMDRAGYPQLVKPHAVPSVTPRDAGGYIGGGRLLHNRMFARGPVATGPVADGTFGTDYAGLRLRPNRVFLAPSYDPSLGPSIGRLYRTDGPYVPDVGTVRPLRNAVIEKREAKEERHGGGE
jgi:hypothetical protein